MSFAVDFCVNNKPAAPTLPLKLINPTWQKLVRLPEQQLGQVDLAGMNLLCAAGLPGVDSSIVSRCRNLLVDYTEKVRWKTARHFSQFERNPDEFRRSEAYYRVLMLITVLQRDCGVRYNSAKISEDVPFDAADSFIHGALLGAGGTCASMPVIYVAIGTRLGYPMSLVSAKGLSIQGRFQALPV